MEWAEPTAGKCSNLSISADWHPSKAWLQESSAPVRVSGVEMGLRTIHAALGVPFGRIQNSGAALELGVCEPG